MGSRTIRIMAVLTAFFLAASASAQETSTKPGTEYRTVEGLDNWTYDYDVSALKPGTYNVVARTVDAAGNVSFAAPFNLIVDPASDLPRAGIVNPLPLARVGADLNVVGTCVDDDAVDHVQIKLDDGEWQQVKGADYWSHYLPTSGMADGLHLITVRGVDVNGLAGLESTVSFHLDRTKPLHTVDAPSFGSIVSGKLDVSGSVYDANGLTTVSYSMDSGKTWLPLRNSYDKKTSIASFSLGVDTRKMPDGPAVLWLRSVDRVGSAGVAVFLYFVDNTKPELAVLSPADGEAVNGRFAISGRVYDKVGVSSLSWTYDKESGSVELLPGNPYFSIPFQAPPKAGPTTVRILVVDVAGNESAINVTRLVDPKADLPVVALRLPATGSTLEGTIRVVGEARDDDGVTSIDWRLDAGPETRVETTGTFSFTVDGAASGPRILSVRANDSNGLAGPWTQLPFTYSGTAPRLSFTKAADPAGERDYAPGLSVSTLEGRASLSGTITAANPLASLAYTVNGGTPMPLTIPKAATSATFTVPLSASLPFGVLDVTVTAVDSFGKTGTVRAPVLATDYARPRAGPLLDFGLGTAPTTEAPAELAIGDATPLAGTFVTPFDGEGIRTVTLEPPSTLVGATFEGAIVQLSRKADGVSVPTLVVVETERGHRFTAGPFIFKTDAATPSVTITAPEFGSWQRGQTPVVVKAADGDAVAMVEFSANGGPWTPLTAAGTEYQATFDASGASGPVRLDVRAVDTAGNTVTATTAFMADATPPEPVRLLPRDGDEVSGPTLFAVRLGESLQSLERVEQGREDVFEPLGAEPVVVFVADVSGAPPRLRLADKAGNTSELDLMAGLIQAAEARLSPAPAASMKTNAEKLPPGLEGPLAVFKGTDAVGPLSWTAPIIAPPDGTAPDATLFADYDAAPIRASGAATLAATFTRIAPDPKKPVAVWGYEPGAMNQPLALKLSKKGATPDEDEWSATLKLPVQADGRNYVWVQITDTVKGPVATMVALDYDSTPPAIEVVAPAASAGKAAAGGAFTLVVRATDARGIASVSYEAGTDKDDFELQAGSGDAARSFSFAPKASSTAVLIRAVDGSGNRFSTTVTVAFDAAADLPVVRFLAPVEGDRLTAREAASGVPFAALVYAQDDDGIHQVNITIDGEAFPATGPGPLYSIEAGRALPGRHAATATATDAAGATSVRAVMSYVQAGAAPTVALGSVARSVETGGSGGLEDFVAGSPLVVDGKTALAATITAPDGVAKIEYAINGAAWSSMATPKPLEDGSYAVRVAMPASLAYERNVVAVRVTDAAGAVSEDSVSFFRVSPARSLESVTAEGIYLYDARTSADERTVVAPGDTLGALWYGRPIESVALEPAPAFAEASFEGSALRIKAVADGGADEATPKTVLSVRTIDGDVFRSAPLALVVDSGQPSLAIASPVSGVPVQGSFTLSGTASDSSGIASLEWSVDGGGSWNRFETPETSPEPSAPVDFSATLEPETADGPVGVMVRATDRAGGTSVSLSAAAKDTAAPDIAFESPRLVDTVNGTILISGYAEDAFSIASIEFSADGAVWEPLTPAPRGASPAETRRVSFSRLVDLAALPSGGLDMAFRATDASGNAGAVRPLDPAAPAFVVDIAADKPTMQIQIPADMEVARSDFKVSGMAFDDDGIAELFWRLDGSDWSRLDGSNGFAVPFKLLDLSDNEHVFEAYAVDLNGVTGDIASRTFRVSREEPVGRLDSPGVEITNKGIITLHGVSSDANGIAAVFVSFDNGATYNAATGTETWSYTLDTRTIPDGVHSVYLRLVDNYETPGFAAGLISVDNTPPVVQLDTPADGEEGIATMTIGGRVSDGIAVQSMSLQISRLGADDPEMVVDLKSEGIFSREVDIKSLAPGWYNIKAVAQDRAGNAAYDSRNVLVLESRKADYAEIIFPAHGEPVSGRFTLDGRIVSAEPIERASITVNGQPLAVVELTREGWFSLPVALEAVEDGELTFIINAVSGAGVAIASEPRSVSFTREGPWVDIDAVRSGDFIVGRPFLTGKAGWDTPALQEVDKEAVAAHKKLLAERRPVRIEVSRDNGKTWEEASGSATFKFRLETQEYQNGALRLLVKATFANGEIAVRKRLVTLDTRKPEIAILKPAENGRYNGIISIEGTASDTNGLTEVSVLLRSGDKSSYEIPGFIQGSYADLHMFGATRVEAGLGLSFFDDNVKLQVEMGKGFDAQPTWDNILGLAEADTPAAELSRFGGYILGAKLLANLAYLPFSYFLGPDWDFFSMSFALGASFTYFSMRDSIAEILSPPEDRYMVLSGVIGQWEFAKFEFGWKIPKTIGLYIEGGLVFIPSEASTKLEEFIRPSVAFGVRIGLF